MTEKISACILLRDDASTCEKLLQQLKPHVDELVCLDTGSSDETPQIAAKYADKLETYTGCNDAAGRIADFADARNKALSLASHPWHFWADADDELVGAENIRTLAARQHADNQIYLIPYNYDHDPAGNPTCVHWRENLVYPRERYKWRSPVHEVLQNETPIGTCHFERTELVRRIHRKPLSKRAPDPDRNLRIMKAYIARVGESDVRALYYLGVEHSMRGHIGEALRVLRRYTNLSGWGDERCLAYLEIARIHLDVIGDHETAVEWALKALTTKSWDAPYWVISKAYGALAASGVDPETNWRKCAHFADMGFKLPAMDTVLFINPMERLEMYGKLTYARSTIGDIPGALAVAREGLEKLPGDPFLTEAVTKLDAIITQNRVLTDLTKLHGAGLLLPEFAAHVQSGLQLATQTAAASPTLAAAPPPVPLPAPPPEQAKRDEALDVVLFVGPGLETWNPETLRAKGMGGSETMAWEVSKRLRALGHRVRVFVQCGAELEGIFDGVEWLDWQRYQGTTCDVLIASRYPAAVDDVAEVKAKTRILWLHDVHAGESLTQKRALRFDAVWCLSEWHAALVREVYPRLDPKIVRVTRNGIDYHRFDANYPAFGETVHLDTLWLDPPRNPKRVVYSSSPDRGLATLLDLWPQVLAGEPKAELHVFYGWDNLLRTLEMRGDAAGLAIAAAFRDRARATPRVTVHGMVGGAPLAQEFLSSGVWAYPTWFSETSCITAMEAQAAGLYCVATPVAALNETLGELGSLVPGVVERPDVEQSAEFKAAFAHAVVDALRGLNQPKSREELQAYAREHFGLDALAAEWDAMLRELVTRAGTDVVNAFWSAA